MKLLSIIALSIVIFSCQQTDTSTFISSNGENHTFSFQYNLPKEPIEIINRFERSQNSFIVGQSIIKLEGVDGNSSGNLVSIDIQTGEFNWNVEIDTQRSYASRLIQYGETIIANSGKALCAVNAENGLVKWKYNFPLDESKKWTGTYYPAISKGVYYYLDRNTLFAIQLKTGEELWQLEFDNDRSSQSPTILIKDDILYTVHGGFLYAVNVKNRAIDWAIKNEIGLYKNISIYDDLHIL